MSRARALSTQRRDRRGWQPCQSGNYLRIWAGSRELNANRRALFANEKRGSVMIFEWLRPSMRLRTSPTTTFFGESNGSAALVTTPVFRVTHKSRFALRSFPPAKRIRSARDHVPLKQREQ